MNRFTKPTDLPLAPYVWGDNRELAIDKLGQLEDIEEELGIDLITLFKAFKEGKIFIKLGEPYYGETVECCYHFQLDRFPFNYSLRCQYGISCEKRELVYLNGYGKTWALTKEELE